MFDIETLLDRGAATPTDHPDLDRAHNRARQMRRRRHGMVTLAAVAATVCVVASLVAISNTSEDSRNARIAAPPTGLTSYTNTERNIAIDYPPSWRVAPELLTPALGRPPYELAAIGTFPMAPADHNCAHIPVNALEAMTATDAFVWIGERVDYSLGTFPPRPARITPDQGTDVTNGTDYSAQPDGCLDHPLAGTARVFTFEDHQRSIYALVALGSDVSAERAAEAYEILNSVSTDVAGPADAPPSSSVHTTRIGAAPSECNASGDAIVQVPDVIGMTLPNAIRAVEEAGLNVVAYGTPPGDPTDDSAVVTAQKPDDLVPSGACVGFRTK
jgi:PASTA domain